MGIGSTWGADLASKDAVEKLKVFLESTPENIFEVHSWAFRISRPDFHLSAGFNYMCIYYLFFNYMSV